MREPSSTQLLFLGHLVTPGQRRSAMGQPPTITLATCRHPDSIRPAIQPFRHNNESTSDSTLPSLLNSSAESRANSGECQQRFGFDTELCFAIGTWHRRNDIGESNRPVANRSDSGADVHASHEFLAGRVFGNDRYEWANDGLLIPTIRCAGIQGQNWFRKIIVYQV